jgi:hypothetical protein
MVDFIRKNNESLKNKIENILYLHVPDFKDSTEYKSLEHSDELVGPFLGAFTQFVTNLEKEHLYRPIDKNKRHNLEQSFIFIENLASSNDDDLCNLVQVEIFENLNCEKYIEQEIVSNLGVNSKKLYEDWSKKYLV